MEENMNQDAVQSATSDEAPNAEPNTEETEAGTPQPTEEEIAQGSENEQAEPETVEEQPFLSVQYNHEDRGLSKEEATDYAQIGMRFRDSGFKFDTVMKTMEKLDYLSAQNGLSIEETVDALLVGDETRHREELEEKYGDDDELINDLMTLYRNKQKEKYEKVVKQRESDREKTATENRERLEQRLAGEFIELSAEFPEIKDFTSLPDSVKSEAAKGRDLMSCYLRYLHASNKKTEAAKKEADQAKNAATGSMQDEPRDEKTEGEKQFLSALWGH